jgi:omega-6 fatty acid desaturase (delta-12 desaturase)
MHTIATDAPEVINLNGQDKNIQQEQAIRKRVIATYSKPHTWRSIWQIINSFIPYAATVIAMYYSLNISYWLTLLLALPAAGFVVRIFIIFHDCGHGSFFRSRTARSAVGYIAGILTFFPYHHWTHKHAKHHATASDLDRRGTGDVWTLTVKEYQDLPKRKKLMYRLYRNPALMLLIGPIYLFLISNRFVEGKANKKERRGVLYTNLGIFAFVTSMIYLIGFKAYLLIQFPITFFAGVAGIWLFYVQHQFEDAYWERHDDWDYEKAAIVGSSFYKLPKILQWFTGNIGFHHVHHLSSKIPNYYLERCHNLIPSLSAVPPLTLRGSLKSVRFRLWDEEKGRLVGFADIREAH